MIQNIGWIIMIQKNNENYVYNEIPITKVQIGVFGAFITQLIEILKKIWREKMLHILLK